MQVNSASGRDIKREVGSSRLSFVELMYPKTKLLSQGSQLWTQRRQPLITSLLRREKSQLVEKKGDYDSLIFPPVLRTKLTKSEIRPESEESRDSSAQRSTRVFARKLKSSQAIENIKEKINSIHSKRRSIRIMTQRGTEYHAYDTQRKHSISHRSDSEEQFLKTSTERMRERKEEQLKKLKQRMHSPIVQKLSTTQHCQFDRTQVIPPRFIPAHRKLIQLKKSQPQQTNQTQISHFWRKKSTPQLYLHSEKKKMTKTAFRGKFVRRDPNNAEGGRIESSINVSMVSDSDHSSEGMSPSQSKKRLRQELKRLKGDRDFSHESKFKKSGVKSKRHLKQITAPRISITKSRTSQRKAEKKSDQSGNTSLSGSIPVVELLRAKEFKFKPSPLETSARTFFIKQLEKGGAQK